MRPIRSIGFGLRAFVAIILTCECPAAATPVFVSNFSFESPAIGGVSFTGGFISANTTPVDNWTAADPANSGVFSPSDVSYAGIPDGAQILYMQNHTSGTNRISQELSAILSAATTYTLTAWVGYRADGDYIFGGYDLELFVDNGGTLVSLAQSSSLIFAQPQGTFQQIGLLYDSATLLDSSLLGKNLVIGLGTLAGAGASAAESDWDDVQLNSSTAAVPEPSTFVLLGVALAAGSCSRKMRATLSRRS